MLFSSLAMKRPPACGYDCFGDRFVVRVLSSQLLLLLLSRWRWRCSSRPGRALFSVVFCVHGISWLCLKLWRLVTKFLPVNSIVVPFIFQETYQKSSRKFNIQALLTKHVVPTGSAEIRLNLYSLARKPQITNIYGRFRNSRLDLNPERLQRSN